MEFKQLYDEWIESSGGLNSAVERSHSQFVGAKKQDGISTVSVTDPFFKVGSLYVFDYVDPNMVRKVMSTDEVPFFDGKPYILALEHDKEYQYGLNLNLLPMQARFALFSKIFKNFWEIAEYNINNNDYKKWKAIPRLTSKNVNLLLKMKSNIAINKYDVSIIRKAKAIEWNSLVPASTLFMKHNIIFNKKKNVSMPVIWKSMF